MGPYPQESESTFGHTFLGIALDDPEKPFLLWSAVNFVADLEGVKWHQRYYRGIFGHFRGTYHVQSIHEKLHSYRGEATREARFFPIKLSLDEFEKLKSNIDKLSESNFEYRFFTNNCAHGLYHLLNISLDGLPTQDKFLTPLGLVSILSTHDRIGEPFFLNSLKERILNSTDSYHSEIQFLEWQNSKQNTIHDADRESRLEYLRYTLPQRNIIREPLFVAENEWVPPHKTSRIDIGSVYNNNQFFTKLRFRPLLHDFTDNPFFYSSDYTYELLSLSVSVNQNQFILSEATLFSFCYTPIYDKLFRFPSWEIYLGYIEDSYRFNQGIGLSMMRSKKYSISLDLMLTNSIRYQDNFSDNIGITAHLRSRPAGRYRYGIRYEHSVKAFCLDQHSGAKFWMSYDINRKYSLHTEYIKQSRQEVQTGFSMRMYF
jgi:hypothetical protein